MHAGKHGIHIAEEVLGAGVALHGTEGCKRLAAWVTHKTAPLQMKISWSNTNIERAARKKKGIQDA
jgi:hypothetical protein